jgi:AcrR family transcriptional regulator
LPAKAPDPSEGGDEQRSLGLPSREDLASAMLRACSDRGYQRVGVEEVLERAGGSRECFFAEFSGLGDCYAAGYELETGRLCRELLALGGAAEEWRHGLRAALDHLADYVTAEPALARTLLIDVHLAGDLAELRRKQLFERLARAIDSAREEPIAHHAPPPLTSLFMVSAIESAAIAALVRDEPDSFAAAVPELEQLVISAYFGD